MNALPPTFKPVGAAANAVLGKLQRLPIGVERHTVTDRASWLAMRQQDVTASVAGCLIGAPGYTSQYGLWALKTGRVQDDPEETDPMIRGRLLEPVAVQLLSERQPTWRVWQPNTYFRDPIARLGATPDCFVEDPERGFGIVQIKSVEAGIFRANWRDRDTREIEPPLWIVIQGIIEAHLTGARWAAVGALVAEHGLHLHLVDIPIHAGVIERVRAKTTEFWELVESGGEPPFDYGRDAELIARLYPDDDGQEIDLTGDNLLPALASEDAQLAEEIKLRAARRDEIKAEVLAKMGTATFARIQGGYITAKTIHRKAYEVKPSSYRSPRFKRAEFNEAI